MNPKPVTPTPAGMTQDHVMLFGQRSDKNGQTVAQPIGVSTQGGLKITYAQPGFTGAVRVMPGMVMAAYSGITVYVGGSNADNPPPPVPLPPRPR